MDWLIILISSIFPLFFLPFLTNPVFEGKLFYLAGAVLVIFLVAGARLIRLKKLTYSLAPLDLLVGLFLLVNVVSWFFLPQGARVRSLVQPLGLGSVLFLVFYYLILSQARFAGKSRKILNGLTVSFALISLFSIILFVLPDGFNPSWLRFVRWLSIDTPAVLAQVLVPWAVFIIAAIAREVKKKDRLDRLWLAPLGVIILVGAGVGLYQTLKAKPVFLDWFSSWAISTESFKRNLLVGVGPGNFNVAFNLYRPLEFNQGDNWSLRFGASRSWLLHVWTELGIVGLAVVVFLFLRSLKGLKRREAGRALFLFWLVLLLFPGNTITLFLLFTCLALVRGRGREKGFSLVVGEKGRDIASPVFGGLLIVLALALGFLGYRYLKGEILFYRSLVAASEGKAGDTYNLQLQAINQNRLLLGYRISFSQTNLALANALAAKGKELTDDERRQISQLLAQAVDEAKAAVALEPRNVVGWENLSQVYRQMINVAQGADQWAITAYQQSLALDPLNPRLRVDYGGLLYGLGQFEAAERQFEAAVNLNPDYANAWYNWAWAAKQQDKLQEAVQRMQQAVNLIEVDSPDYQRAFAELEEWKKDLGETAAKEEEGKEPEELTPPQPLPTPIEEPIVLPEEAAPPEVEEVTPEPTQSLPTPTPTPGD